MYLYRGQEPLPPPQPPPMDGPTLRAWANYELKNKLAREEYARLSDWIDTRYGPEQGRRHVPGATVTRGNVVSLHQTRPGSSLGQTSRLDWSA